LNSVKDKYIFVKSQFAGRDFGDGENSGNEEKIQDKYILGSLTSQTKRDFGEHSLADEERLRGNSFADEERFQIS
jgi:hypothetical protein